MKIYVYYFIVISVLAVITTILDKHFAIKSKKEKEELIIQLMEENNRLKEELNAIAKSKSWRITKPIRDFRAKRKK